jgi:dephospho-CoA kinase
MALQEIVYMGKRPGKFIIGLTGNIGTGKSLVRRMLEHLGAYGIDADALSHRAVAKGAPAYEPVVQTFGKWILAPDGEIDRLKLAKIVFTDPNALGQLESIIHPWVIKAIDVLVQRAGQNVIVVEAIKLLESPLRDLCDSIWVVTCPPEVQMARLVEKRQMTPEDARQRISAQPPQAEKVAVADVVIDNKGTYEDTWRLVATAYHKHLPGMVGVEEMLEPDPQPAVGSVTPLVTVVRARSRDADSMAKFLSAVRGKPITPAAVVELFGENGYYLAMSGAKLVGVMGWQVENLVARGLSFEFAANTPISTVLPLWVAEMEHAAAVLQAEAALMFVPAGEVNDADLWKRLGYEVHQPADLSVRAWQEAAAESMPAGTTMYFKQLRVDRVLRPI